MNNKQAKEPINLLLVDKNPVVIAGLVATLKKFRKVQVVGTASSLEEVKKHLTAYRPYLLITNTYLKDNEAGELLRAAIANNNCGFVVLTITNSVILDDVLIGLPVDVPICQSLDEAIAYLVKLRQGKRTNQRDPSFDQTWQTIQQCDTGLTLTEWQVLMLMSMGMRAPEISRLLTYSSRSIRRWSAAIYEKLKVKGAVGAVVWVLQKKKEIQAYFPELASDESGVTHLELELTQEEIALLKLMAQEKSDAEMARQLHYSLRSIRRRNGELFRKLNVGSRLEATIKAVEEKLI